MALEDLNQQGNGKFRCVLSAMNQGLLIGCSISQLGCFQGQTTGFIGHASVNSTKDRYQGLVVARYLIQLFAGRPQVSNGLIQVLGRNVLIGRLNELSAGGNADWAIGLS